MTILIDNTIDTIRSTINGIDLVSEIINAYNEANGAFNRANTIDGIASLAVVAGPGLTVNSGVVTILTANGTFLIGANTATTGAVGVVQLTDSQVSTSTTTAATPNSVKLTNDAAQAAFLEANSFQSVINSAFALANSLSGSSGIQTLRFNAVNGLTVNGGSFVVVTTASNTINFSTNTATTGAVGVVQLNDIIGTSSTSLAATANTVATAWNYAQSAFIQANATNTYATSGYGVANSAQNLALSAFAEANSFQSVINTSFAVANSGQNLAVSAFAVANSGQNLALSAFAEANTINLMTPMYNPGNNVINFGGQANTRGVQSKVAYANGNFANIGDAQWAITLLRSHTSGAAATVNLSTSGANTTINTYGSINQLALGNNSLYAFSGTVAARDTTNMFAKIWEVKGGIKNVVGAPSTTPIANVNIIGTPIINIIAADNGTNNWAIGLTTDLANNALLITATGSTNTTNWVASIMTTEVA